VLPTARSLIAAAAGTSAQINDRRREAKELHPEQGHDSEREPQPKPYTEDGVSNPAISSTAQAIWRRERKRLSYDLHDGPARRLVECMHWLDRCDAIVGSLSEEGREALQAARRSTQRAMEEMRRVIHQYRSPDAEDDLYSGLIDVLDRFSKLCDVPVTLDVPAPPLRLNTLQMEAVIAVVEEALFNAWRHGDPTTMAVTVDAADNNVEVTVKDDGRGFDPTILAAKSAPGSRVGLLGLEERVAECGGELSVESAPGQGVVVRGLFRPAAGRGGERPLELTAS